jgi:hypothetical protein
MNAKLYNDIWKIMSSIKIQNLLENPPPESEIEALARDIEAKLALVEKMMQPDWSPIRSLDDEWEEL